MTWLIIPVYIPSFWPKIKNVKIMDLDELKFIGRFFIFSKMNNCLRMWEFRKNPFKDIHKYMNNARFIDSIKIQWHQQFQSCFKWLVYVE